MILSTLFQHIAYCWLSRQTTTGVLNIHRDRVILINQTPNILLEFLKNLFVN